MDQFDSIYIKVIENGYVVTAHSADPDTYNPAREFYVQDFDEIEDLLNNEVFTQLP